mmetsp:Transcript_10774/g.32261  ORF Transcript_10774/g.32261 Transcript_10774/m.32261 type:complete len:284 (+) Transcript_10774:2373-3224(+)
MFRGVVTTPRIATMLRCSKSAMSAASRSKSALPLSSAVLSVLTAAVRATLPRTEFVIVALYTSPKWPSPSTPSRRIAWRSNSCGTRLGTATDTSCTKWCSRRLSLRRSALRCSTAAKASSAPSLSSYVRGLFIRNSAAPSAGSTTTTVPLFFSMAFRRLGRPLNPRSAESSSVENSEASVSDSTEAACRAIDSPNCSESPTSSLPTLSAVLPMPRPERMSSCTADMSTGLRRARYTCSRATATATSSTAAIAPTTAATMLPLSLSSSLALEACEMVASQFGPV